MKYLLRVGRLLGAVVGIGVKEYCGPIKKEEKFED
jgi:hypothetical protein